MVRPFHYSEPANISSLSSARLNGLSSARPNEADFRRKTYGSELNIDYFSQRRMPFVSWGTNR
jgi:hypothetical protein